MDTNYVVPNERIATLHTLTMLIASLAVAYSGAYTQANYSRSGKRGGVVRREPVENVPRSQESKHSRDYDATYRYPWWFPILFPSFIRTSRSSATRRRAGSRHSVDGSPQEVDKKCNSEDTLKVWSVSSVEVVKVRPVLLSPPPQRRKYNHRDQWVAVKVE